MWTPIFEQNKKNIVKSLDEYIQNLESFKLLMQESNFDGIHKQMNNTNKIKQILKGISLSKTSK